LHSADAVLVPVAAEYLAVEALRATLDGIRAVERERDMRYSPLAILPTMVNRRRPGSRAAAALLRERFGDLVLPDDIPYSARLDSASLAGVPLVAKEPASLPALAYRSAARGVLAQLGQAPRKRKGVVRDFVRADMRSELQVLRRTSAP
jgi:chromosome partitioning protein